MLRVQDPFAGDEFNGTVLSRDWVAHDASNGLAYYGYGDKSARHIYDRRMCTMDGDDLVLTAKRIPGSKKWRSCFVAGRQANRWLPLYGTVSVRALLPQAPGMWPAIWLRSKRGASRGEVDIAEVFRRPDSHYVSQAVHAPQYGRLHYVGVGTNVPHKRHTYWARIEPEGPDIRVTVGVDRMTRGSGLITGRAARELKKANGWDVALNLAVTCRWQNGLPRW